MIESTSSQPGYTAFGMTLESFRFWDEDENEYESDCPFLAKILEKFTTQTINLTFC